MRSGPIVFALIREGTSDDSLIPHLQDLLLRHGIPAAVGQGRSYRGSTLERLRSVASEESAVDLIFAQRYADGPSAAERRREILDAADGLNLMVVPVVPVQELEAWLLTDESAIRAVAGKPSGRGQLRLPKVAAIEATSSPKEKLQQALVDASETSGRRREKAKKSFPTWRRTLLQRLDIDGRVRELPSWRAMEDDIAAAAARLLDAGGRPHVVDQL